MITDSMVFFSRLPIGKMDEDLTTKNSANQPARTLHSLDTGLMKEGWDKFRWYTLNLF